MVEKAFYKYRPAKWPVSPKVKETNLKLVIRFTQWLFYYIEDLNLTM